MEKCQFGLVLLLVLCAVLPAEAQPPNVIHRYRNFLNQHVYIDMTERKCTSEIYKRKITDGNTNNCKEVNTFIKANSNLVKAVCGKATRNYTSGQPFTVVTCKLHSGERRPRCDYGKKGHQSTRYINISCDQGWPVHYIEDHIL
ncbi:ribonuclease-like 3 [Pangasianodon hypophthalmus]|uniref:ribonuclease-like 3 n=1 Tax=Pangasianodon hypophthalmus TaxID=310915 RepID=UPI002306F595|nr:ribonuclease-like 3 [Pangasianodon hypophthalmus]